VECGVRVERPVERPVEGDKFMEPEYLIAALRLGERYLNYNHDK
jgi:hypothetical protein